jgi:antitoxin MazE
MEISLVQIGNSKGIRIPKSIIDQLHISDKLEMEIIEEKIILKPIEKSPRLGWEKQFKEMHLNADDQLLIDDDDIENENFQWEW